VKCSSDCRTKYKNYQFWNIAGSEQYFGIMNWVNQWSTVVKVTFVHVQSYFVTRVVKLVLLIEGW